MKTIDVHAHQLAEETLRLIRREAPELGIRLDPIDRDNSVLEIAGIIQRPFPRAIFDLERRFADMQQAGIDVQAISVPPQFLLYDQDPTLTGTVATLLNDATGALVSTHSDKFVGLATVPLTVPEQAATELRRAMRTLGLRGALIGSHVVGRNLDDPDLEPFWETADELGAFLLIHPHRAAASERLRSYYLRNLIGNPMETTIAAAALIFGGVIERYPRIAFCLAHGGGFLPYQAGRLRHGWEVRSEPKRSLSIAPAASIQRLYYDTILHSDEALGFLIGSAGAGHVLLGTDYPFDMGRPDCAAQLRGCDLPEGEREAILGGTAQRLLRAPGSSSGSGTASEEKTPPL